MYCSAECRDSDWNSGHKDSCFLTHATYRGTVPNVHFDSRDEGVPGKMKFTNAADCVLDRLICFFGMENLKKAARENEPMKSFSDPRTKGFKDGKFDAPTLEAFLSLEDNVEKLTDLDKNNFCMVILLYFI